MYKKETINKVLFNSDDPERQLVVSETLSENVYLFGIKISSKKKIINQDFEHKKVGGSVGFK